MIKFNNTFPGLILLFFAFTGCKAREALTAVTIDGFLTPGDSSNLEGRQVFLFDLSKKGYVKDSCIVSQGKFHFFLGPSKSFVPFEAAIKYIDTVRDTKLVPVLNNGQIITYMRPIGYFDKFKVKTFFLSFYVSNGHTVLRSMTYQQYGNLKPNRGISFIIHQDNELQNEPFYKGIAFKLSSRNIDDKSYLQFNKDVIRKYPSSVFLLKQLYQNKESFSVDELKDMLSEFDSIRNKSLYGHLIDVYFNASGLNV